MSDEKTDANPPENPHEGGSYVRHDDGRLERVEGTAPAPGRDAPRLPQLDHDGDGRPGGSKPGRRGSVKEAGNA